MTDLFDDFSLEDLKPQGKESYLPPDDEGEEDNRLRIPYVKIMQGNSRLEGYPQGQGVGMIAVGRNETPDGANSPEFVGYLFERGEFRFFLIDKLTNNEAGSKRRGARGLWKFKQTNGEGGFDENGGAPQERKKLCSSTDGIAPVSSYLGKAIVLPDNHPKYAKHTAIIGISTPIPPSVFQNGGNLDIKVSAPDQICAECPLGQWYKDPVTKKNHRLCNDKFNFVVYLPPQPAYQLNASAKAGKTTKNMDEATWPGGYAIVQGGSVSAQMALTSGDGQKTPVKALDGHEIKGIFSFIAKNQVSRYELVAKGELDRALHWPLIRGFAKGADADPIKPKEAAELIELGRNPEYTHALIEIPTYKYAQLGLPQHVGIDEALAGMRYINMGLTQSIVRNNPYVPDLFLDPKPVSREDVEAWLEAGQGYKENEMRNKLLFTTENLERVQERLLPVTGGNWRALLGEGTSSTDDVVDGEFVNPDDL